MTDDEDDEGGSSGCSVSDEPLTDVVKLSQKRVSSVLELPMGRHSGLSESGSTMTEESMSNIDELIDKIKREERQAKRAVVNADEVELTLSRLQSFDV